jgi:7-carboxy-7-deazaguanine synthase
MRINLQPIEKPEAQHSDGAELDVHWPPFYTIQGEGPLTGHPAIFIRLAGCNLQCPLCDTTYTGPMVQRHSVSGIMQAVNKLHPGPRLVVITGGEPFRQNITPLVFALLDEDYQVQIESNGTLPPPPDFPASTGSLGDGAWVIVSPKAGKVHPETASIAVAWKYVLSSESVNNDDGLPIRALDHRAPHAGVARPPENFPVGAIYLQPADEQDQEKNAQNLRSVMTSCMRHGYTLQLQLHKILNLE